MKYKILLKNINKAYIINKRKNIKELLLHPFSKKNEIKIEALKNINLTILKGDAIGIIGRNGAGKTTLLKILSNIIPPTTGKLEINGNITSLIELGIGFSTELTGIENIYLTTSFYGMSNKETSIILNSIIEFSELSEFIRMPIKYYSKGMILRLGFSIAIHLSPDILIIDEILAVGDEYFQNKCINKLLELKSKGTTLIMVSHNLNLLYSLSDKIIWLDKGEIKYIGNKKTAIKKYMNFIETSELNLNKQEFKFYPERNERGITISKQIKEIIITIPKINNLTTNKEFSINIQITANKTLNNIIIGFAIHTIDGMLTIGTNTKIYNKEIKLKKGKNKIQFTAKNIQLNEGIYTISIDIHQKNFNKIIASIFKKIKFKINNGKKMNDGPLNIIGIWRIE